MCTEYVRTKFPATSEGQVKAVITNKLSNEAKLLKRKVVRAEVPAEDPEEGANNVADMQ